MSPCNFQQAACSLEQFIVDRRFNGAQAHPTALAALSQRLAQQSGSHRDGRLCLMQFSQPRTGRSVPARAFRQI